MLIRPCLALRPYVQSIWATHGTTGPPQWPRERVLPGAQMHLAFRLDGGGVRLYRNADDAPASTLGHAVVAGLRSSPYFKDISTPSRSVGALLQPGAALALFGCGADELSEQHVALDALWGNAADSAYQQLAHAAGPEQHVFLLQKFLLHHLRPVRGLHPSFARTLQAFRHDSSIAAAVQASGCSHRHFITQFKSSVGLPPKRYARLLRLQHVLHWPDRSAPWSEIALAAGFSDQAHLNREFGQLTGLAPQQWRRARAASPLHLRVD
ncbi:AraC-like DNA-binding protein [Tahibacter aquaticus]|uniref:AraC-like DNA-binding protein n=1 Tax=Tahibacter aquaticus TaxID=520092 RepID=A0A4R6Z2U1_9GAMM|nr:AraC family transcriptional regulator [Tahibacter aquaticus]TDR45938.1 AraC-like DNA-binding protein [Tahibacter aquaticus]